VNRRIAITGAAGFIGRALAERIDRETGFESVRIVRCDFEQGRLFERLAGCEAVVHLAGLSRGDDPEALYQVNMELTESVAEAVMRTASIRRMVFCSTTHEAKESAYHASKRDGRAYFDVVAAKKGIESIGVLMPNVFGPGGRPFYNSVVATFCKLRSENKPLTVHPGAGSVKLIYIDSLVEKLLTAATASGVVNPLILSEEYEVEVAEIARLLESFDLNGCPQERFARDLWKSINLIP
jgi:UDP-2-acetamido-2,6-beta-L-arabino-hexul-4-ose reductase